MMWRLFMLTHLAVFLLVVSQATPDLSFAPPGQPAQLPARCKNIPGTLNWPPDGEWVKLKTAVGGRLIKPAAPAAGCHRNAGINTAGAKSCADVNAGWHTAHFHLEHPTSTLWQNWNNYSCPPDATSQCSTTGYPVYVVAASQSADVKAAVDFARMKNIRLNIKGTGHDFLGR